MIILTAILMLDSLNGNYIRIVEWEFIQIYRNIFNVF